MQVNFTAQPLTQKLVQRTKPTTLGQLIKAQHKNYREQIQKETKLQKIPYIGELLARLYTIPNNYKQSKLEKQIEQFLQKNS